MKKILLASLFSGMTLSSTGYAQNAEQRFQDMFVTAGYSTAFGAALGAAFLGLSDNPAGKLNYIAMGASLGFIGGSALGAYFVFAPTFVNQGTESIDIASTHLGPKTSLTLQPVFQEGNLREFRVASTLASW